MKKYVNSSEILVFPSTRRSNVQASARYQLEQTFTETVTRLADYNEGSFIITPPYELLGTKAADFVLTYNDNEPFEFMIHGYWFKIAQIKDMFYLFEGTSATKICACIELDKYLVNAAKIDLEKEYKYELIGRDDTNYYTGLKFMDEIPTETDQRYVLPLFERPNKDTPWNNWVIVKSLYKYDSKFIDLNIDGGIIRL